MRAASFLMIILLLLSACKIQEPKQQVTYHPFVLKAKETSLYTKEINWIEVNQKFKELTKGKESIEELKEGLQYLINSLGDKHAKVLSAKDYSIVVWYTGEPKNPDPRPMDSDFRNSVINDISAEFSYQLLENKVGYLKVVGIGPGDVKEQADYIRKGLLNLKEEGVDKWILDLRYNGGGNMEPMLSGLAPLIGEGYIGGSVDADGEERRINKIENGQFNNWGRIACEMTNQPEIASAEKVAVLLSRYTVSSGEVVAVSFKGRPNTTFIGEYSGGYTTGNGYDQISDDLILVISGDIYSDRNGKSYPLHVDVDVPIPFDHKARLKDDLQIKEAITWLNK